MVDYLAQMNHLISTTTLAEQQIMLSMLHNHILESRHIFQHPPTPSKEDIRKLVQYTPNYLENSQDLLNLVSGELESLELNTKNGKNEQTFSLHEGYINSSTEICHMKEVPSIRKLLDSVNKTLTSDTKLDTCVIKCLRNN